MCEPCPTGKYSVITGATNDSVCVHSYNQYGCLTSGVDSISKLSWVYLGVGECQCTGNRLHHRDAFNDAVSLETAKAACEADSDCSGISWSASGRI